MVALLERPMRLVQSAPADRRLFPRTVQHGPVHTRRLDHSLPARQNPSLTLELRDVSVGGMSAIADLPLHRGERLSLRFAPEPMRSGWSAFGRVVRCEHSGTGYRVAVEFDPVSIAA